MELIKLHVGIYVLGYCYGSINLDKDYYDDVLVNPWNVKPNPNVNHKPCNPSNYGQSNPVTWEPIRKPSNFRPPNQVSWTPITKPSNFRPPNQVSWTPITKPSNHKPPNPITWKPTIPKKNGNPNPVPPPPKENANVGVRVNVNNHYPSKSKVKQYVKGSPWTKVSWIQARRNCKKNGQELATITSKKEQDKFATFLKSEGVVTDDVWIGLSDKDEEGNFKWVDNKPLSYWGYSNWLPGEPSNTEGVEHCVEAVTNIQFWVLQRKGKPDFYQWNDSQCDSTEYYSYYVCQYYTDKKFDNKP